MRSLSITHDSDAGQRLDRFLRKYLPNAPLGVIFKMLRTGKIKVSGKKKDQTYKIETGDEITFWISDAEFERLKGTIHLSDSLAKTDIPVAISLDILFEDSFLLVLNKPSGINVHPGDHKTDEASIIEQVQDYLSGKYDSLTFRPALVHRIDRDTSGCLLIAKEKSVLEHLLHQLQSHTIEKIYHAIVSGIPAKGEDTVSLRLLRIENAKNEAKVQVHETGQSAITHYSTLLHSSDDPSFSLLECRIETGRTHQIRVHMASIGHPILGDKAYGDKNINSYAKRHLSVHRQLLHARSLSFIHPKSSKRISVLAPYPADFREIFPL